MSATPKEIHVYPVLRELSHELKGYNCECEPKLEYFADSHYVLVIHKARYHWEEEGDWAIQQDTSQ